MTWWTWCVFSLVWFLFIQRKSKAQCSTTSHMTAFYLLVRSKNINMGKKWWRRSTGQIQCIALCRSSPGRTSIHFLAKICFAASHYAQRALLWELFCSKFQSASNSWIEMKMDNFLTLNELLLCLFEIWVWPPSLEGLDVVIITIFTAAQTKCTPRGGNEPVVEPFSYLHPLVQLKWEQVVPVQSQINS